MDSSSRWYYCYNEYADLFAFPPDSIHYTAYTREKRILLKLTYFLYTANSYALSGNSNDSISYLTIRFLVQTHQSYHPSSSVNHRSWHSSMSYHRFYATSYGVLQTFLPLHLTLNYFLFCTLHLEKVVCDINYKVFNCLTLLLSRVLPF